VPHGRAGERSVLAEEIDGAPVGQFRDQQPRQRLDRGEVVPGLGEELAGRVVEEEELRRIELGSAVLRLEPIRAYLRGPHPLELSFGA
jgi:hypothetical protein